MRTLRLITLFHFMMLVFFVPHAGSEVPKSRPDDVVVYGFKVIDQFPHDSKAFTEGLFYQNNFLYERTGLYGESSLRKVRLKTGEVLEKTLEEKSVFGEGIAPFDGKIIGLSWKTGLGYVWNNKGLKPSSEFKYKGEGWGLTENGRELIESDGTNILKFIDPKTFGVTRTISVVYQGQPVIYLNELEWVEGTIYANVWQTDAIVRIDPHNGAVTGIIDLSGLLNQSKFKSEDPEVLNGIAYDPKTHRLFVTGKRWPAVFQIQLIRKSDNQPDSATP